MTTHNDQETGATALDKKTLLEQAFDGIMRLSKEQIREIRLLIERMGY